jgi:hypothetical protein
LRDNLTDFDGQEMKFEESMRKISMGNDSARANNKSVLLNKLATQKKI